MVRGESSSQRSSGDVPAPPVPVMPDGYTLVRKTDRGRASDGEPSYKKPRGEEQHQNTRLGHFVTMKNGRPPAYSVKKTLPASFKVRLMKTFHGGT